ncbi:NACHT domain-containing protein [Sphaerisporangium aureirubrum]|uniref:NACHT domain-containing protein n=1 Tax=Sphaerisporangium aureirubrum TaxID=1544736 RepID=A0ABW1NM49_9ACTN
MSGLRTGLRIMTGAAGMVAVSVATSQVFGDGRLSWGWAYVSVAVAALSLWSGEVLAGGTTAVGAPRGPRGRRGTYMRQLRDSVRAIETIGVGTNPPYALQLRQVYVDVSLTLKAPHDDGRTPRSGPPGERRPLESFLRGGASPVLVVKGDPGSGKTTLVRHTAQRLCERGWSGAPRRLLPVLLYLREHACAIVGEQPPTLGAAAVSAGWLQGKVPASWVERRLDRGGCVVMLDGLDEVPDGVVAWVRRQIERYPRNRFIITSRSHGFQPDGLPGAEVLQVRRFTGEQISRFLDGWYYAIECRDAEATGKQVRAAARAKAEDLIARLRATPALYDLAANPLLLTMIANVHLYRNQLPGSRAELYAEMCEVLLHRRQEAKRLADATGLRGPQKENVVRRLALAMTRDHVNDISVAGAEDMVEEALRQISPGVDSRVFLEEVVRSGLLVERGPELYAFAHPTLQEYLTAEQIRRNPELLGLLTENVDDPWWRETTRLWAAGADDATLVIAACIASGTVRALALALDCAEEAVAVDPRTRAELETLPAEKEPHGEDDARRRLITGVKAARGLRDVIVLGEGTAVCAHPVKRELWALFTKDRRAAGRHIPRDDPAPGQESDPATGMWGADAARFVSWLNTHFDDGTVYRLPTDAELADPAAGLVGGVAGHTVWAHGEARPRLYRPDGAPWPYEVGARTLRRRPAADRASTTPYLRIVVRQRAFDGGVGSAGLLDLGRDGRLSPGQVERLPRMISWADAMQVRELARDLARELGVRVGGPAKERDRDSALDHASLSGFRSSVLDAFQLLVACRATTRNRRSRTGEEVADFDDYLTGLVSGPLKSRETARKPPDVQMRRACDLLRDLPGDGEAMATALRLAEGVRASIVPILDRSAPCDPMTLTCARVELLAVLAVLSMPATSATPSPVSRFAGASAGRAVVSLAEAFRGLVAIQERAEGHIVGNEILLLVRQ